MTNLLEVTFDETVEVDAAQVKGNRASAFGSKGGTKDEIKARFVSFLTTNTVVSLGQILSESYKGHSLASYIAAGAKVPVAAFQIKLSDGSKIAPKNVEYIGLDNVSEWGCILSCKSAHGTGVGASGNGGVRVSGLEANKFYYAVESQTLFTISATCLAQYVVDGLEKRIFKTLPTAETPGTPVEKRSRKGVAK